MRIIAFLILILGVTFFGCDNKSKQSIEVIALSVDAEREGDILVGPGVLNDSNRFVWGGSVVKGYDQKYHMLYATWEKGDSVPVFKNSWVLNSKIAYAVSDFPDRNFQSKGIVLSGRNLDGDSTAWDAQMVHNPHLRKFNGKYYLYFIGSKDPGVQPLGSKGENLGLRDRVQQNQKIGVIEFDNFEDLLTGKFTRPDQPILKPRTRVKPDNIVNPSPEGTKAKPDNIITVNPSVEYRPSDGKYLLFYKGNFYDPGWRGVHGVAIGDSPAGPFTTTDNFVFDIINDEGKIASGEDPFVWYHPKHKKFYVVLKDFTGRITGREPGLAILESQDGIDWEVPENPFFMKKEIILKNGEHIKANRLERPQLLIDENGNPQILYSAGALINVNERNDGTSFNVHIPLQLK
jgi:hypothetical protein